MLKELELELFKIDFFFIFTILIVKMYKILLESEYKTETYIFSSLDKNLIEFINEKIFGKTKYIIKIYEFNNNVDELVDIMNKLNF